jgi:hypothetical protein
MEGKDLYAETGAWQGYLSVGLGSHVGNFDYLLSYGYTPTYIGGHSINQFHLKGNYNLLIKPIETKFYITAFILYGPDHNLYIQYGSPYPDHGYYPSTAILFGTGVGFKKEITHHHSLFIEWTILSPEIERFYNNKDYDDPLTNSFGMGFGYVYRF